MKKILLGTTTLIGAAGLFAGAALADTPKVTLGGLANFEVGIVDDNQDKAGNVAGGAGVNPGANERPQAFRSQTTVTVRVDGKSDAGLGYGGGADLQADTSNDAENGGVNARRTFIYLEGSNWGRTELGSEVGADATMKVDASSIARGTGGIDGDFVYFANNLPGLTAGGVTAAAAGGRFIATPDLPVNYGLRNDTTGFGNESTENVNKVTYYTPRFAGFQVGVSYMPDDINRGQGSNRLYSDASNIANTTYAPAGCTGAAGSTCDESNIFAGGINYDNKFDQIGVSLAATGEWGNSDNGAYDNLAAYNAGGKLSYMGFSLAGSYGNWGNSYRLRTDHADDSHYWNVGGAYEYGPFGVSVTYLNSLYDNPLGIASGNNKFHNLSFGTDYKLAPGLTPYAELDFYHENYGLTTVQNNTGTLFLAGTQLAF